MTCGAIRVSGTFINFAGADVNDKRLLQAYTLHAETPSRLLQAATLNPDACCASSRSGHIALSSCAFTMRLLLFEKSDSQPSNQAGKGG
jgi:hypothetical protein